MAADAKGLVVHLVVPKGISLVWMWHNEHDKIMECDKLTWEDTRESPLCLTDMQHFYKGFTVFYSVSLQHSLLREYEFNEQIFKFVSF